MIVDFGLRNADLKNLLFRNPKSAIESGVARILSFDILIDVPYEFLLELNLFKKNPRARYPSTRIRFAFNSNSIKLREKGLCPGI